MRALGASDVAHHAGHDGVQCDGFVKRRRVLQPRRVRQPRDVCGGVRLLVPDRASGGRGRADVG